MNTSEYTLNTLFALAEICARQGVKQALLSPGSRCAPLTLAFARHPDIALQVVPDERSAAFTALGMAQQSRKPIVLICTSGSAGLNYAPAIAEAYYQHIPLIVLSADRPPEWIDQWDGQTIRQDNMYGAHIKRSFSLPADYTHKDARWQAERQMNEALIACQEYPAGPVHLNIPLREPFYPENEIAFPNQVQVIRREAMLPTLPESLWPELVHTLASSKKILIVPGQGKPSAHLNALLGKTRVPCVADIISNVFGHDQAITQHEIILAGADEKLKEALRPDLLITFGQSLISKSLKTYLRQFKATNHWHIQPSGQLSDPYQSLSRLLPVTPEYFFEELGHYMPLHAEDYMSLWKKEEEKALAKAEAYFKLYHWTEIDLVHRMINQLPAHSVLHLANSMSVRYANFVHLKGRKDIEVYANRGTSGIDGVVSTACGAARNTDKPVTLITGDMAFLYDRNAFWNNDLPANLRIFILNNQGGGIFRLIDGPSKQKEIDKYFVSHQPWTAENTLKDVSADYFTCRNIVELDKALEMFWQPGKLKVIEAFTDNMQNAIDWKAFKDQIK